VEHIQGKKELDVRVHSCSECGYTQDRDVAASEVIRNRGLELIAAVGTTVDKQPSNGVLAGAYA
jgi:putative transposase